LDVAANSRSRQQARRRGYAAKPGGPRRGSSLRFRRGAKRHRHALLPTPSAPKANPPIRSASGERLGAPNRFGRPAIFSSAFRRHPPRRPFDGKKNKTPGFPFRRTVTGGAGSVMIFMMTCLRRRRRVRRIGR
jgi:hypothetical protein